MNKTRPMRSLKARNFLGHSAKFKAMRRAAAEATAMMIMASQASYLPVAPRSRKKIYAPSAPKPCLSFRQRSRIIKSKLMTETVQTMAKLYGKRARK